MSIRHLSHFFAPGSIAVLGASEKRNSLGGVVVRNLLSGGYAGTVHAVNPKGYADVHGVPCFKSVAALPEVPDLAVVCTGASTVPRQVSLLGKKGVKAALVLVGGLARVKAKGRFGSTLMFAESLLGTGEGKTLRDATAKAAARYGIRIMGPNCIGVMVPSHKLNASYSHLDIGPGKVAFVGQSGVLGLALIDWACGRGIGFSHLLTLGDSVDVDTADVIDYLAGDRGTKAILLHIERLLSVRKFISSVRAASRSKLVLAIKSARVPQTQDFAEAVAPGLGDGDIVYDAALRRAGVLRVERTDELFDALDTLTRAKPLRGERLAILCNGLGPNILAADRLIRSGGKLASLSAETSQALSGFLPSFWRGRNPIDLNADATPERYARAFQTVSADPGIDAILLIHVPTLLAPSDQTAAAVSPIADAAPQHVFTCWMGQESAQHGRKIFDTRAIPTFATPDQAIDAFMHLVNYHRNRELLHETPPSLVSDDSPDPMPVWAIVGRARRERRAYLMPDETDAVLRAYGVPMADGFFARTVKALLELSAGLQPPFALKIIHEAHCPPFSYVRSTGVPWRGVALDLSSTKELESAARNLQRHLEAGVPGSRMLGFVLQRMRRGLHSLKLNLGVTRDEVFGPLIFFGIGGDAASHIGERGVALPPLNLALARHLVDSSHLAPLLNEHSIDPDNDRGTLCRVLVQLSRLVVDVPVIRGVEICPLLLNREGVVGVEASIDLGPRAELAIQPYPEELRESIELPRSRRSVELRPIRGEDEPAHQEFANHLSPESIRYRFFQYRTRMSHLEFARLTQIDYAREMAFIASARKHDGGSETLGVVRAHTDPDNVSGEVAVIVRDDLRGEGLGRILMKKMIDYCTKRGTLEMVGTVLPENLPMLRLAEHLGFTSRYDEDEESVLIRLALNEPMDDWQRERLKGGSSITF